MAFVIARRELIVGGIATFAAGRAWAQRPIVTPPQIEGPFYPYDPPAETDWDLVRLSSNDAPALGEVVHVFGTVKGYSGRPYRGALVELWQTDSRGKYRHPDETEAGRRDPRFQGYGRAITDTDGAFRFRTIRPVAYPFGPGPDDRRAPHKHLAVSTRGVRRLTTQLYVAGEALNDTDRWLNMVADPAQRSSLIRPYEDGSAIERGAKQVRYDVVLIA
jgi:protocatechuate 3,4-dioxygenase beta subunit